MFKVRKWSDSNTRPYDVVYVDDIRNNIHYQPGVEFSTIEGAYKHKEVLIKSTDEDSIEFIRNHWPTDGAADEDNSEEPKID